MLVGHDFTIDDENKIYFLSNEPLGNDDDIDEFWGTYDSFSDVGENRVYFASKILTPCRMH